MKRDIHGLADVVNPGVQGQALALDANGIGAWRDAEVVNVREYGILGDATNEYAKIQGLIDAIRTGAQKRRAIIWPDPPGAKYVIDTPIDVDMANIFIKGAHRGVAIEQSTANQPVFRWTGDLSATLSNVRFEHLTIRHAALADAATTKQYGIMFRPDAATTGTSGGGAYLMAFIDCWFNQCYVGIGQDTSGSGTFPIWSTLYRDLVFRDTKQNAIKLQSAGNQGQPNIVIDHVDVLNYNTANLSTGPAIMAKAVTGLTIMGLNVEDWQDQILNIQGGSTTVINGLRTERHDLMTNAIHVLYFANGQFMVNGVDLSGLRIQHGTGVSQAVNLVRADVGAKVTVNGMTASKSLTGYTPTAGRVAMLSGDPSTFSHIYADGIVDNQANLVFGIMPTTGFGGGPHAIVRYNGMPPTWDALPPASSIYRGRLGRIEGSAGVADTVQICEKNAADAYVWRTY